MKTLQQEGIQVFMELGPQPILLGMGRRCLAEGDSEEENWLPSLRPQVPDSQLIYRSLGALYVRGAPVNWAGVYRNHAYRWTTLPSYPIQRKRFWTDSPELGTSARRISSSSFFFLLLSPPTSPLLDHDLFAPTESILFETRFGVAELPVLADPGFRHGRGVGGLPAVHDSGAAEKHLVRGRSTLRMWSCIRHWRPRRRRDPSISPSRRRSRGATKASFRLVSVTVNSGAEQGTPHVTGSVQMLSRSSQHSPLDVSLCGSGGTSSIPRWWASRCMMPISVVISSGARVISGLNLRLGRMRPSDARLPDIDEGIPLAVDGYQLHQV
jgi:hypothetical protein